MRKRLSLASALAVLSACASAPGAPAFSQSDSPMPIRLLAAADEQPALEISSAGTVVTATPGDRQRLALTVYHHNMGRVADTRRVTLPAGPVTLRFTDVAKVLEAPSVQLRAMEQTPDFTIREQFFSSTVLTPTTLLEKFVGKPIQIRIPAEGTQPSKIVDAVLVSVQDGTVVRIGDRIYPKPPGDIILPALPKGLSTTPTLEWLLSVTTAGAGALEASYSTSGLSWQADYTLTLNEAETSGTLQSWATLTNQSGIDYSDAHITVVAGTLNRDRFTPAPAPMMAERRYKDGGSVFTETPVGDYHRYDLKGTTSLENNQTKQLTLLDAGEPAIARKYRFESGMGQIDEQPRQVQSSLTFANTRANGLGVPLPQGRVRVYQTSINQEPVLVGEDTLPGTAVDEQVKLVLGTAFDVVGQRRQASVKRIAAKVREESYAITLRNHKTKAVTVEVVEHPYGDWKITEKSHPFTTVSANEIVFPVPVPAGGKAILTYTIRITETQ